MEYKSRKVDRKKRKKYRINALRFIKTAAVVVILVTIGLNLKNIIQLKIEQRDLKAQYAALETEKDELTDELKKVNDPRYIEEQARKKLKLIKPGEKIYIVEDEK